MIFEDAHWIDPTSLEALGRMVDRIAALPVLLIVTSRPEFVPPWPAQPHVTTLAINRLPPREIGAMIDRVVGKKHIPANIRQDIIERTDGIPLFVEEMTKAVLEAIPRMRRGGPPPRSHLPPWPSPPACTRRCWHGSTGSALPSRWHRSERRSAANSPMACWHRWRANRTRNWHRLLDRLLTAGVIFRQGVPPHATYLFNHALVQDAAYGTLLREQRRAIHARIGKSLEGQGSRHCGEPAGAAGASLHRSRPHRESRRLLGQSGTAVAGTLGPD